MVVAGLLGDFMREEPARGLEVEHRDLCAKQRRLNPLALAGLLALEQGDEDAHRAEDAGGKVGNGNTGANGTLAGEAGDGHQPAHALGDLVEARAIGVGAVLAEAGNAGIDEARVKGVKGCVVDTEAMLDVGAVILDEDVGGRGEAPQNLNALGSFEVERHAALVAMEILEIEAVARADLKTGIRAIRP